MVIDITTEHHHHQMENLCGSKSIMGTITDIGASREKSLHDQLIRDGHGTSQGLKVIIFMLVDIGLLYQNFEIRQQRCVENLQHRDLKDRIRAAKASNVTCRISVILD